METTNKRTLSTVLLAMSMLIMLLSIGMMLMNISEGKKKSSVIPISMLPVGISLWVVGTAMRRKAGG